jgi:hypothetical protein
MKKMRFPVGGSVVNRILPSLGRMRGEAMGRSVGDGAVDGGAGVTIAAPGSELAAWLVLLVGATDEPEHAARLNENTTADRGRDTKRRIVRSLPIVRRVVATG